MSYFRERRERRHVADCAMVLGFLLQAPEGLSSSEVWLRCGINSGRTHLALFRLEKAGAVVSHWEPREDGGPRRRIYQLFAVMPGRPRTVETLAAPALNEDRNHRG